MARIKKNSILEGIRGTLGDLIIRQMRDGSVRVNVKPARKKRKFNQAQEHNQDRFKIAVAYAREAKTDPYYAGLAEQTGRAAYHLALSDGLTPPVIHEVERSHGRVYVQAGDDVMVARVWVSILDREGNPLEGGYAAQPDPLHEPERWEYAARAEGAIEVAVWDLAGNRTAATMTGAF